MLGIRYINDTAVDIWVGKKDDFVTDIKSNSDSNSIKSSIEQANSEKLRHLGIIINSCSNEDFYIKKIIEIFDTIKQTLNSTSDFPKRITLILNQKEDYSIVQEIMFKTILKR